MEVLALSRHESLSSVRVDVLCVLDLFLSVREDRSDNCGLALGETASGCFFSVYPSPAPRSTVPPRPLRRPTFGPRSECALDPGMVPSPTAQVCPLWVPHQVS